jgi:hypothetical protein
MHADADIARRLLLAAVRRRAPLWLAAVLPWCVMRSPAGVLGALAWAAWDLMRLRARVRSDWARWLDGAVPALEDSSALLAHAVSPVAKLQRSRLLARLSDGNIADVAAARVHLDWGWALASLAAALSLWGWQQAPHSKPAVPAVKPRELAAVSGIVIRVAPPKYTKVASLESAPRDLQVPQNSAVEWCQKASQPADEPLELSDGQVLKVGAACAHWTAAESVFWRWRGQRYNLRVTPDQAPQVTISAPRDMLQVLPAGAASAAIAVAVRDDYAVKSAVMHMTLARGSGENIRFSDREVPLPASNDPRVRNASRAWSLT